MTKNELLSKIKELHKLQTKYEELQEKVNGLKDEIKAEMTTQEIKKMKVGDINVSCTKYVTHRFNTEKFKANFGYLYESYLKEVQMTRFTLTKVEKVKATQEKKKLIRKIDGKNGFEIAKENLKMLETCATREEVIELLNTTTKNVLSYMAIKFTGEYLKNYSREKKQYLVELVADRFIATKQNEKVEVEVTKGMKATENASKEFSRMLAKSFQSYRKMFCKRKFTGIYFNRVKRRSIQ
ncbi:MAG: hypothetical protein IJP96_05425 [Synergistaceae bacterium]|nr:hypothetical protein [Synergistaceae bacterium]MBR0079062.1 hypothetical protein [Synergistaceae bacterium]